MKTSQILVTSFAFILGAVLVAGVSQMTKGDDVSGLREDLAKAQAEIDRLKAKDGLRAVSDDKLTSLPSAISAPMEEVAATDVVEEKEADTAEQDPAEVMANLFNSKEARGLIKQMSAGFAQRGEQWIEQGIAEYTDKLNLSDAQVAKLKSRLTDQMKEQMDTFNAKLDNENMSMQEIMQEQREVMMGQEDVMASILKEELEPEQYEEFEREQLVERTQRVQRDADRELSRLDSTLDLTESQEDQVFGILVQTNSEYDPSMGIEGADATVTVDEGQAREDAIRSVLDPSQVESYNQSLEQQNRRRGPWGGGFGGFGR